MTLSRCHTPRQLIQTCRGREDHCQERGKLHCHDRRQSPRLLPSAERERIHLLLFDEAAKGLDEVVADHSKDARSKLDDIERFLIEAGAPQAYGTVHDIPIAM